MNLFLPSCEDSIWFIFAGMHHLPPIYAGLKWRRFSTQYTSDILVPSILSRAQRRNFHPYSCTRSSDIWPTRTALLAYERALELEAQIDAIYSSSTSTRARSRSRSVSTRLASESPVKGEAGLNMSLAEDDGVVTESQRARDAREVLAIFEIAYAEWKSLGDGDRDPRPRGLERFDRGMFSRTFIYTVFSVDTSTGYVLTRIVQKGAEALGILKNYYRELEVLEALLSQRRWRRGRRGKWYERRALVLTRYCDKSPETLRRAICGLLDSLNDRDTHLGECARRHYKYMFQSFPRSLPL